VIVETAHALTDILDADPHATRGGDRRADRARTDRGLVQIAFAMQGAR